MAQTRLKSGNLHMIGGDNGSDGNVLKSKGDGTMEWGDAINPPTFSSVDYPGDDTALDPAGGQSLIINGGNFLSGITASIGGTTASSVTLNSASQITITTPAKSAGTFALVLTNINGGTATAANAVSYNGIPAFTNAAGSLGSVEEGATVNLSAAATEPDGGAITYAITSGSLPSGLSLNTSTGTITGTAPSVSADTTSNFTVTATDNENQTASRAYSITITNILPSGHFNTVLYTGNGSTQSITGVGFQPDLVWVKRRSNTEDNAIFDSSRGVQKQITANKTNAESTKTNALSSFDSDGFTTGTNNALNTNTETYVAWCFKGNSGTTSSNSDGSITSTVQVNNTLGFSIVRYTGTGSTGTYGHGLSSSPNWIITKRTDASEGWLVWSSSLSASNYIYLNGTGAAGTDTNAYKTIGATTNQIGTDATVNTNGGAYISYCFHNVDGFTKTGTYTGTGAAGNVQNTGFEPAFVLIKRTDSSGAWSLYDNKRNTTNPRNLKLVPNSDAAENAAGTTYQLNFFTNGFEFLGGGSDLNASNGTFIYIAFAADPDTTTPTLANSFDALTYTGSNSAVTVNNGFKTGLLWSKARNVGHHWGSADIVRGGATLFLNEPNAQPAGNHGISVFGDTSTTLHGASSQHNTANANYIGYFWKADHREHTINTDGSNETIISANANAGFSIVKCSNIVNDPGTFGHGLSSAPEMIITKRIDGSGGWQTYHTSVGTGNRLELNSNAAAAGGVWNSTAPTSTVFSYNGLSVGQTFIAYCFHSVTGYSKIGSYNGNGSTGQTITTGFQPDFVMIKATSHNQDWYIIDSKRSNNKFLVANLSGSEYTASDTHSFLSTGFALSGSSYNNSGYSYIYMAFKIN